ncbi:MAG: hypothetical protein RIS94_2896 [Pseudomonadota bacterium]|jgi:Flp pilus assembly protein TadG
MKALLQRIRTDRTGSTAVEFAAVGPMFLLMMLCVFQFAAAIQAYNGMAGAIADLQRVVTTQDQSGNPPTTTTIQANAIAAATSKPYYLKASRLAVTVSTPSTQRISGAKEYTVSMVYAVPVMLFPTLKTFRFTFKRAVFVKA